MVEKIAPKLLDHISNPKKMQLIAARVKLLASNLCKSENGTAQHAHNRTSTTPHQPKRQAAAHGDTELGAGRVPREAPGRGASGHVAGLQLSQLDMHGKRHRADAEVATEWELVDMEAWKL
jgi:hypothetical protein